MILRGIAFCAIVHACMATCFPGGAFDHVTGEPCDEPKGKVQPSLKTTDGNVVLRVAEGRQFGVTDGNGATKFFPADLDKVKATLDGDILAQAAATNSTNARLLRTERELGLDDAGAGTTDGGLGKLLGGLLEEVVTVNEEEVTSLNAIKAIADALLEEQKAQTEILDASNDLLAKVEKALEASSGSTGTSWLAVAGVGKSALRKISAGGEECRVAGRSFLPGVPGLYQCKFTDVNKDASQRKSIVGTGVGINVNSISCAVPAWKGELIAAGNAPPSVEVTMELFEDGVKLPYTGKDGATIALYDPPPQITKVVEFPDCVAKGLDGSDACTATDLKTTNPYTVNLQLSDANANKVVVSATSSDQSIAKTGDITFEGSGNKRQVVVKFRPKTGTTKIAITATDEHKQKSGVVTLELSVKSFIGVDTDKLACFWSFDNAKDPGLADFAKNGGRITPSRYSDLNPGQAGDGKYPGGNAITGRAAFFNNNDNKYFKFGNSQERCTFQKEFTLSIWVKHVSCHNNQIPIIFGCPGGSETCGSFYDAHNPFRFDSGRGSYDFPKRQNDWYNCNDHRSIRKWQMHTITSNGKEMRAFHNGKDYGTSSQSWKDLTGIYISHMGVFPGWGTNGLYGYLDEVGVWDRALEPSEVHKLYNLAAQGISYKVNLL